MPHPSPPPESDESVSSDDVVCPKCGRNFRAGLVRPTHCPDDGAPLVTSTNDPRIGRTLAGRFTLLARLGAGSMGTVFRARQLPVGRNVAIKILRSDRAVDEAAKARFLREARTNSLLTSPHTVTVFDFGQSEAGDLYLAMELLEGESLGQRLTREKRLPPAVAVDVCRQTLRSLAEAHKKGIVHRDLKPDNVFFSRVTHGDVPEEIVKVLDFGIAKMLGEGMSALNAIETQAGTVFGTPRYMSPEQAQAKPLDGRSDLYSLGVILYHMLTGRPPFTDDDAVVVMARHIKTTPKRPREAAPDADIPPELEAVVLRALEKDPERRPATAEALSQELALALESTRAGTSGVRASVSARMVLGSIGDGLASGAETSRNRALFVAGGVVFLVAAIAAGWLARSSGGGAPAPEAASEPPSQPATAPAAPPDAVPTPIPVVDINALPTVAPPAISPPAASPQAAPRAPAAPPPKKGAAKSGPPPASAPPPPPAKTPGRYGILE